MENNIQKFDEVLEEQSERELEELREGLQEAPITEEDEKDWMTELHSTTAKKLLLEYFVGKGEIEYVTIESFIIENTMLNGNQILEHVLKPLIQDGKIKKLGYVSRSSNHKKDKYIVGASNGN